jgi:hypothetical protein
MMTAAVHQTSEQPATKVWPNNIAPALQLATLAEVGAAIASVRTIEEILGVLVANARWILNYQRCSITVEAPSGDQMRVYAQDTAAGAYPSLTRMPLRHGLVGQVLASHQPLRLSDIDPEIAVDDSEAQVLVHRVRSILMLPLVADNRVFGTLTFSSARPNAFQPETLALGRFLSMQVAGAVQNALLLEELDGRENVIVSLALAIEAKDPYTEGHCQRLAQYAERLGRVLDFDPVHITKLRMAAILHDVGKIAVPEGILQKPDALTDDEYKILQLHPVTGESICQPLRSLRPMLPAIRHHHERWDGRGYPDGLVGEAIPLDARIIAIVDAFDAMTSDRPYRLGMPVERALAILRENRGPQWDTELLDAFIPLIEADLGEELVDDEFSPPVGSQRIWSVRRTAVARPG